MTVTTTNAADWKSADAAARVRKRHAGDLRLKFAGMAALGFAVLMLAILLVSLFSNGYQALRQTHATVEFVLSADHVDAADPQRGNYRAVVQDAVQRLFPEIDNPRDLREATAILSTGAQGALRSIALSDPSRIGSTIVLDVPLSDPYDQLAKGLVDRDAPENQRRVNDAQIALFDRLAEQGLVSLPINWALVTNADSRFPELAGLQGAIWGSFYALLVCFVLSFPTGIAAGIYLEEFAPKNR
ncbi:DUF3333 domain-containing protein, partial [Rubrimonas sp.]|uniref:DUF3333 domain-containing protein n=1 Tax=Rubrimonas sp. TaxID=2036015 RepID=UPI002FDEDCA7